MSSCCGTTEASAHPCPQCGHVGPIVGTAPVRPHLPDAVDGDWQHCANESCEVIFHLGMDTVDMDSVSTQVGLKATDKETPVCFCFAHTADDLAEDYAANNGVSEIKASIKAAVANGQCACEHLNPRGKCCLADVHRILTTFARPTPVS
ncbi:hypothetical protein [Ilumatobacter sp.]|uniref:hypothetical protein n=1 Tax=Ilumatobacter sp. TaxID=1967498 RepID=UPI00375031E7